MRVLVEADGGSRGNPGPAGYGAVVLDPDSGEVLAERSEFIGTGTNNVAEYQGLLAGLSAAAQLGADEVDVRMDSKLVVEQMCGRWQVKHAALRPLARQAAQLRDGFERVSFTWIPRAQNVRADRLANEAMDHGTGRSRPAKPAAPEPATHDVPHWAPPEGAPTRLVLVRHGSTEHSAEYRLSGRNDLPLNDVGKEQAQQLAERVRAFGEIAAVVSSPLRRARQTAEVIAGAVGAAVEVREELTEMDYGAWEGRTAAEARAESPDEFAAWLADPNAAPPGGESFAALARRVRRGRDAIIAAWPAQVVVVVSHVTPIKTLIRTGLGAPVSSMFHLHLDTGTASILDYFADGNASLRLFNA